MKSFKLLTSTFILGAVLTACSSDSVSGNFKAKNEYQEKALKLIKLSADSKVLSYEEVKAKYNIPATAKMCELKDSRGVVVVFSDNAEDYESYLQTKAGKYIYIPIFYTYTIAGKQAEAFDALNYKQAKSIDPSYLSMEGPIGIDLIDPKTCE